MVPVSYDGLTLLAELNASTDRQPKSARAASHEQQKKAKGGKGERGGGGKEQIDSDGLKQIQKCHKGH